MNPGLKKFQNKLISLVLFSTLIPATIISAYSIYSSTNVITDLVIRQLNEKVNENSKKIDVFLENVSQDVLYLSKTPPVQGLVRARSNNGVDPTDNSSYEKWIERLEIIFVSILEVKPYYLRFRYLDEAGNELVRVDLENNKVKVFPRSELGNDQQTEFFQEGMKEQVGGIYVSHVDLSEDRGEIEVPYQPTIRFVTPIYSADGQKKGVIVANVLADYFLSKMLEDSELNQLSQGFVVNENGYYISHPNPEKEWGFQLNKAEKIQHDYPTDVAEKILAGGGGSISNQSNNLLSYATIFPNSKNKQNPFFLVYEIPKKEVFASIQSFKIVAIGVCILSLGAVLIITIIVVKNLVRSIGELIGVVSSFSLQVLTTIDEQERMATQQSSSVQETTVTMDELNASSRQCAKQAEIAAALSREMLNRVEEGAGAVGRTLEEMGLLKNQVEAIADRIVRLSEQTNQIGSISALVSDLANQTNMLAINAAVEAVRAGDSGTGFGVVATEIRKLADQSKKSAQKINAIVGDIQTIVSTTVMATDEGTKKVDSSLKIAEKTAASFESISGTIDEIVSNSQQIALTANQQAAATQQVVDAMNALSKGAGEAAMGISQTKIGTQKLNEAALSLQETI